MKRTYILLCFIIFFFSPSLALAEIVTFEKEYTYQASEFDSKASSRILALEQVKRLILEELGTYLISETEVKNFQLTKDQITIYTAGIVQASVLDEKWDGKTYYLKAKLSADPKEVAQAVNRLRQDKKVSKEIEATSKRADDLEKEVIRLRIELTAKTDADKLKQYNQAVNRLSANDWIRTALTLVGDGKNHAKNKEALNALDKASELSPKYSDLYMMKATLLYWLLDSKDYDKILSEIDKAIAYHPLDKAQSAFKTIATHLSLKAKIYKDKGDWQKALNELEKAINTDPGRDSINSSGTAPDKPNNNKEWDKEWNKTDFDEMIKKYPKDYRGYLFRATYLKNFHILLKQPFFNMAVNDYKKAISLNPRSAMAYYLLGALYNQKILWGPKSKEDYQKEAKVFSEGFTVWIAHPEECKQIIAALSKAIQLNPKMTDAWRERAEIYLNTKDYKLAIKDYNRIIEMDPDDPGTYHDRAIAHKGLKEYDEAIRDLTKAIELKHPSSLDWPRSAYEIRASVYELMKQYENAIGDYTKAIEIWMDKFGTFDKEHTFGSITAYELYSKRAAVLKMMTRYQDAVDNLTEAIKWIPTGAPSQAYADRGDVYIEMEKAAEAVQDYTKAIESNQKMNNADGSFDKSDTLAYEYYLKRADAYAALKNMQAAIQDYQSAIAAVEDIPLYKGEGYEQLGTFYWMTLGIKNEAINAYTQAIKFQEMAGTKPFTSYLSRGNVYFELGNINEALRDFTSVIAINPKMHTRRGVAYFDLKQYIQAIEDFNKAIELEPTNSFAYFYRGIALINMEKYKQGIDDIKIAARLGHKEAQEKLKATGIDW